MTTSSSEESAVIDQPKQLMENIVKGDSENAARIAGEIGKEEADANEVVDIISNAMNIVTDLHEMERYSSEEVEKSEDAADKALEVVRPKLRIEQRRVSGRIMVSSLIGDPHNFDKTLLLTMLEIGGLSPIDGGTDLTSDDIARKVSQTQPDILAVPLVSNASVEHLLKARTRIEMEGSKTKVVAYGRGISNLPETQGFGAVEEDSLGALRRIMEICSKQQQVRRTTSR
jgi:methanogenic corrinoid protein MtbC1